MTDQNQKPSCCCSDDATDSIAALILIATVVSGICYFLSGLPS